jgi:hypothetical protein
MNDFLAPASLIQGFYLVPILGVFGDIGFLESSIHIRLRVTN